MLEITEGTKRMMQKRREAARAGVPAFNWGHWYNKDVGRLLRTVAKPHCPDCGEELVKAKTEDEEGNWTYAWLCGCKAEPPKED